MVVASNTVVLQEPDTEAIAGLNLSSRRFLAYRVLDYYC